MTQAASYSILLKLIPQKNYFTGSDQNIVIGYTVPRQNLLFYNCNFFERALRSIDQRVNRTPSIICNSSVFRKGKITAAHIL